MLFDRGDRVFARGKSGTVVYRRMAPPTFSKAEAYSVVLDERRDVPGYTGTIFSAQDVSALKEDCHAES